MVAVEELWLEPSKNESEEIGENKRRYKGGREYGGVRDSKV